ncbi:pentapeptide repeat-containing protein [Streptomyces sp. NPDC046876]|uniref:pentapeptide repeat-containing protein n=1 Tax=Streptomyces sp. NPDC046876 TaxID=3155616 RepID=UPI0033D29440
MTDTTLPPWSHCGHGRNRTTYRIGCRGILVPGYTACLYHLSPRERKEHLGSLGYLPDVDYRGTRIDQPLLESLLQAVQNSPSEAPEFGAAQFYEASFYGDADFRGAMFYGPVNFEKATFNCRVSFDKAVFHRQANFDSAMFRARRPDAPAVSFSGATFDGVANFWRATFNGTAPVVTKPGDRLSVTFVRATFNNDALFTRVTFSEPELKLLQNVMFDDATFNGSANFRDAKFAHAWFQSTTFHGPVRFDGATFSAARFTNATFGEKASQVGPLVCGEGLHFDGAIFQAPVAMLIASRWVYFRRTRWESMATLRLRYADVDLEDAVLSSPVAVSANPVAGFAPPERLLDPRFSAYAVERAGRRLIVGQVAFGPEPDARVRVYSLRGVDAAHLVLTDTDLSKCEFVGALHLDQLRIEGNCAFAPAPEGWTQRRVLIEEHYWRALNRWNLAPPWGWLRGPHHPDPRLTPGADDLAGTYRSLRKALEDVKNEPDAADFYYGEMEMRRKDRQRPWGERTLLSLYWFVSGYGLRASRAVACLGVAVAAVVLALMAWGLPTGEVPPVQYTRAPAGEKLTEVKTVETFDRRPGGRAPGPWPEKFSRHRAERALRTAVNSVAFRSPGQGLTRAGTYIEMAARLMLPLLLLLLVLAVRGRVKR